MSARRARQHSQKAPAANMTCTPCKNGNCNNCCDIPLALAGRPGLCACTRRGHAGEPADSQVADPFTGTVHAPGLSVTLDGDVTPC